MAFPGTYNINYYKGDTLEFRIYPKDAAGASFLLDGYVTTFTIAEQSGAAGVATQIEAYTEVSADKASLLCVIRPEDGELLDATKSYVYDVQIDNTTTATTANYANIYTILTGSISVTEQVTGATA
jgi:hypothetical protein